MRASPELIAVFERYIAAFVSVDTDTIRGMFSGGDEVVIIGTDGREWIQGAGAVEVVATQMRELPPTEWTIGKVVAFEEGSVGWVAADTMARVGERPAQPFRVTAVFHLDHGAWRITQWHASVPVDQVESFGVELTTSLEEVLEALDAAAAEELQARLGTRIMTIVFTDVVDSSTMLREIGARRWTDLMRAHADQLSAVAQTEGGVLVKTLGDGAMLAFDSASAAVRGAVAIQRAANDEEPPLRLRIGIHVGDVVRSDGDFFGQVVNKAARIASAASGGEIVVSDAVRALVGADEPSFGAARPVQLKGIPGIHVLVPYRWEATG